MSSTNQKADPLGRYYTPEWAVAQCIAHVLPCVAPEARTVLEPSAGRGAFLPHLRQAYPHAEITAMDVDEYSVGPKWDLADQHVIGSFLGRDHLYRWDLIVGNPPFSEALAFCRQGLRHGRNVAFLLRQGFLSSAIRYPFFAKRPPTSVHLLATRPSFTGNGKNDSCDYCWVCWSSVPCTPTALYWLPPRLKGVK